VSGVKLGGRESDLTISESGVWTVVWPSCSPVDIVRTTIHFSSCIALFRLIPRPVRSGCTDHAVIGGDVPADVP
jgi:hypothetical protein